jgi:hypothetical protein
MTGLMASTNVIVFRNLANMRVKQLPDSVFQNLTELRYIHYFIL